MAKIKKIYPSDGTTTLVLGIVLTVIGGSMLLERILGYPVWDSLWKLWPVLLIAMGVKILIDHYRKEKRSARS